MERPDQEEGAEEGGRGGDCAPIHVGGIWPFFFG